jgi:hypothetical protein
MTAGAGALALAAQHVVVAPTDLLPLSAPSSGDDGYDRWRWGNRREDVPRPMAVAPSRRRSVLMGRALLDRLRHRGLWNRFRPYTMSDRKRFVANLDLVASRAHRVDLSKGCYVECGTWRGGMSFGIMQLPTGIADYHFFDSFQGLPPASAEDGAEAIAEQRDGRLWHDNNTADRAEFEANLARFRQPDQRTSVTQGWFADTLPGFRPPMPIAILRMDGDWYESTLTILRHLFAQVMTGGLIIIDDYYDWPGCARAVHEFLAETEATERLRQTPGGQVAYMIKE